jgi:hemerythrin-like domain-containing protein
MLRDRSLIPLSHQHQHALALCVRIDRAQPIQEADLEAWLSEIEREFEPEIKIHFSAEENVLFPLARQFPELIPLVEELIAEHGTLRKSFAEARERRVSPNNLPVFAKYLSSHIRKEERQLFERLQQLMSPPDLELLGAQLETALKDAAQSCLVPNSATKLKPRS